MNPIKNIKFGNFFSKLILYLLVIYTFFMLGRVIWKNYQLKKQAENIKRQISQVEAENKDLSNLILYYQSDSFREVEARKKLGLKKPDEKVVNIPVKSAQDFNSELQNQQQNIAEIPKSDAPISNWKLWWQYFTK